MDHRFDSISMNGRMAYVIMCVEKYLVTTFPDKDWTVLSNRMWKATSENWGDWPEEFSICIPDVFLQYDEYDRQELNDVLSEGEYRVLKALYRGITEGREDDPSDEVNYMLNKPYEMAMVYEGTVIGDGKEAVDIITDAERVLIRHGIALPDHSKVQFSSIKELNGWGNDFDGRFLSIILK